MLTVERLKPSQAAEIFRFIPHDLIDRTTHREWSGHFNAYEVNWDLLAGSSDESKRNKLEDFLRTYPAEKICEVMVEMFNVFRVDRSGFNQLKQELEYDMDAVITDCRKRDFEAKMNEFMGIDADGTVFLPSHHFEDQRSQILDLIQEAKQVIWISIYTFTDHGIAQALVNKVKEGVTVELIISDNEQNKKYDFENRFLNQLTKVYWYPEGGYEDFFSKNHEKFMIIDCQKVMHGSRNFTLAAEHSAEHITVDTNPESAEAFVEEWKRLRKYFLEQDKLEAQMPPW